MARLNLALLGPLHVTLQGQPVTSFGYDKVRALLAYLAVEARQPHDRTALAALLWPGEPESVARKNLRTALANLRQAIDDATAQPPFLRITRDTIQFNSAADYALDVAAFTALLTEVERHEHNVGGLCATCAARLGEAAELYRGAFLQQVSMPDSVAWEEWALLMRERLHGQMLDALALLMAYHEQQGEDQLARHYAWQALGLEGWDEAAHRCLLRVFARNGQRSAALAQYERCRRVLADELGIEPSAETTALYECIRAGPLERAVGLPSPAGTPIPAALTPLLAPPSSTAAQLAPSLPGTIAPPHSEEGHAPTPAPVAGQAPDQQLLAETNGYNQSNLRSEFPSSKPSVATESVTSQQTVFHPSPAADRNRSRMLTKVRQFWIDGILEQSLHGAALIKLGLAYQPEVVERPWELVVQQPSQGRRTIPPGTPLVEVYDELAGELLILGAPGSGKTTLLLELARDLIARAEQNPELPMPVVFNLSSWAAQRRPLAGWLVEELNLRYQVPRGIGQAWIAAEQVLPLLDGLDEVALEHRAACVAAINLFREEHWLLNIVVCSRSADYDVLTAKLRLHGAVVVQPLTDAQVDTYLAQGGERLAAVRTVLHEDATLRELADTPLMLAIMALAYQGLSLEALRARASLDQRRADLFDTYVRRMFARRGTRTGYTPQQTIHWLAWLARTMVERSQSIFFIEGLQPNLLPSWRQRRLYDGGVGLAVGVVAGMFAVLANLLALLVRGGLHGALVRRGVLLLAGSGGALCGGALGMALGVVALEHAGGRSRQRAKARHATWLGATLALAYGLTGWVAVGFDESLPIWPSLALVGMTIGLVTEPGSIVAVERYRWSWPKTQARLPWILCFSLLGGIIYGAIDGLVPGVGFGLVGLFVYTLALGLSTDEIETRTIPNQGLWRSARNAVQIVVLFGMVAALSVTACFSWSEGVVEGLAQGSGAATVGALLGGLVYGGLACIQHVVLRFLLWRSGAMPWHYARFLDYAADCLFLRKVGGGYIFIHRLLLEYFAVLSDPAAVLAAPQPAELSPAPAGPPADVAVVSQQEDTPSVTHQHSAAAWRTAGTPMRTNLPAPPTPLIGRDDDVAAVCARLRDNQVRLLTLTGAPGIGKTRLGLAVGAEMLGAFGDGVYVVALAPIRDAALVPVAIATPLGVKEVGDRPLLELLSVYLREKRLLLVLDNCEHLLDAALFVADLLASCPHLKILATSRTPLYVRAERQFPVPPLALPGSAQMTDVEAVGQAPAVALFVERAQAANPDFALQDDNAAAVAAICARLDGLPLAIELAALRSMQLSPEALLVQLNRRLAVLTDGPRDLPERQRTLQAAINWSYDLLNADEQRLFARLGVFVGGCTLEAAEAVCNHQKDLAFPLVDGLAALVRNSLLQNSASNTGEPRFGMLESIHEYALERLKASDEIEEMCGRHAKFLLALAEAVIPKLHGPEVLAWLARLEEEHDNVRAALRWCRDQPGQAVTGLRLAGALWWFWQHHNHFLEGRTWIETFLQLTDVEDSRLVTDRARALLGAGWLAYYQDDYVAGQSYGEASLALYRRIGDHAGQADALNLLGFCVSALDDYPGGIAYLTESVALSRSAGDAYRLGVALVNLGYLYNDQGDLVQARPLFEEGLAWGQQIGHPVMIARALNALGELARMRGVYKQAEAYYNESLLLYHQKHDRFGMATLHHNLGCVAHHHGDDALAQTHFERSLVYYRELGHLAGMAAALFGLASVVGMRGCFETAARLFGAAQALRDATGAPFIAPDRYDYERMTAAVRAELGAEAFAAAWQSGQRMAIEEAIAQALDSSALGERDSSKLGLCHVKP